MDEPGTPDIWASGDAYEPYVGRWSRAVGREFLTWLAVPPDRRWLDVGCGTGALTATILEVAAPSEVVGVDPSDGFIAYARARVSDPCVRFEIGDARALPLPSDTFDAVVSGLALNFVPDPAAGVRDMARVATPGGVVAAYVWDYSGGMEFMRRFWDAAVALDPAAATLDEGPRFAHICDPDALSRLFSEASLQEVETRAIDIPTHFRDVDDYWTPFLGGQGPAPSYVSTLTEEQRAALRDRLRASLLAEADGSIRMTARAWAVRGAR